MPAVMFQCLLSGHLLSWPPFLPVETTSDDQVFSVYLGNIPADVLLEEVQINGKQLMMSEGVGLGYSISPIVHINGSRAYELRLPFEDTLVYRMVRFTQDHFLGPFQWWWSLLYLMCLSMLSCNLHYSRSTNQEKRHCHDPSKYRTHICTWFMFKFRFSSNQDLTCVFGFFLHFFLFVTLGWVESSRPGCGPVLVIVCLTNALCRTNSGLICVFSLSVAVTALALMPVYMSTRP